MFWPLSIFRLMHAKERYVWAQILILQATDKAALVDDGMKIWIQKPRIRRIRLRNTIFEVYVKGKYFWINLGLY